MKKKVITGDWDGEPIWREVTAAEVLLIQLKKAGLKEIDKVEIDSLIINKLTDEIPQTRK